MNESESDIYQREQSEPHEGARTIPLPLTLLFGAIACWGSYYYGAYAGVSTVSPSPVAASPVASPAVDGKKIFETRCAACHQKDGRGVSGAFPPLDGSEWVNRAPDAFVAIVLHGLNGEITVKGESFQGQMPSFKKMLKDEEIAALATYVRSSWSNSSDAVEASQVSKIRNDTSSRETSWGGEKELREYLGDKAP